MPIKPFLFLLIALQCYSFIPAQRYNPFIDVQHYTFELQLNDTNNILEGKATVTVQFTESTGSFFLDLVRPDSSGKGMLVSAVKEGRRTVRFTQDSTRLTLYTGAKAGSQHRFTIWYKGIPADGLIISSNKFGHRGFFGDNWPNRAHNWLPCVDHPSDKATVDFIVTAPDHYTVVANGAQKKEKQLGNHFKRTYWKESEPLAPKVMVIGVAGFAVDYAGKAAGVPVYNYVFPENRDSGFRSYANALRILPFYTRHIGPYPFEKCGNVQSKTRFGGLENASAIFYFESSVSAPGIESLMAHEIAHQWFGDAVTETDWPHLWLSEGFATYMTHLYLEYRYGVDTLKKGLLKDRESIFAFEKKRYTPVVDTTVRDDYMQLLNPNSYEKGGWVLHMLRRRLGDALFWKGIAAYYATFRNKNAGSTDFEKVMETVSGQNLQSFFHQWLFLPGHPSLAVDWQYNSSLQQLTIRFRQKQEQLFSFPLAYAVDGLRYTVNIRDKTTTVQLPLATRPEKLVPDPDVNLLADFEITEQP